MILLWVRKALGLSLTGRDPAPITTLLLRMKLFLRKIKDAFVPDSAEDADNLAKIKQGDVISAEIKRPRNYRFHKKLFVLWQFAYDNWEQPGEIETKHGMAAKSFDCFRRDLTILAGYYDQVIRLDGTIRVEAKSISFSAMEQHEFDDLYSRMIQVVLTHVLRDYTREDLDQIVDELMVRFA